MAQSIAEDRDQHIRLESLKLAGSQYKDALVGGRPPEAPWLIAQAAQFESYIKDGKDS